MFRRLPRRLRLVFGVTANAPDLAKDELDFEEFVAYATDCRVFGQLALPAGRLTELLNAYEEFELVNVQLQSLADGHVVTEPLVILARDEVVAVHAAGSAGHPGRRTHTRAHRLVVRSQPYTIWGDVHALPGADPVASFLHRPPMVPLTDAWIAYELAGRAGQFQLGTIIVNRNTANSFEPMVNPGPEPPAVPAGDAGPLARDFTSELHAIEDEPG